MAMPALKVEVEAPVAEERLARLEATVEHIQSDLTEVKGDIRDLRKDIQRLDDKIDGVKDSVAALALYTERGFSSLTRWGIGLYIALAAGMATGFMWVIQRLPPIH